MTQKILKYGLKLAKYDLKTTKHDPITGNIYHKHFKMWYKMQKKPKVTQKKIKKLSI